MAHPGGLREIGPSLTAARVAVGDTAALRARRDAALQRLASGRSLREDAAAAAVTERLQTVHEEAAAAGLERAAQVGERATAWVTEAMAERIINLPSTPKLVGKGA